MVLSLFRMAAGFARMVCDMLRLVNSCYHQVPCIAGLVSTIVHEVSISTLQLYRTKAKKRKAQSESQVSGLHSSSSEAKPCAL